MEPNWGLYNSYYSGDRPPPTVSPHQQDRGDNNSPSHRRTINQEGTFLPPPPPSTLPPLSGSYPGSGYHSSSSSTVGLGSTTTAPSGSTASMHMTVNVPYGGGGHMGVSQPIAAYHYPLQSSPATMSALPSGRSGQTHGYSPRIPGGYPSASPAMNPLSPLSPSTHVAYQTHSSTSTSASSYPPSVPPPHSKVELPMSAMKKRRANSGSEDSWGDDRKDDDMEQPWGMPQDQYKALNPRDKKQVRNRIGARRFRAKRKDYVSQLEGAKKESDARIVQLESHLEASRREINELRSRLNMAPLPPQESSSSSLGLVMSNTNAE